MKVVTVAPLLFAGLTLVSCQSENKVMVHDAISHGFNCITPLSSVQLTQSQFDPTNYEETAPQSGKFVPKGWHLVTQGTYQGCYVPAAGHSRDTTLTS
jgi:hypothetical protein